MQLYNDYSTYLRNRHGAKVYRIALDAGFSCPNRDGTKGRGGCLYCNEGGARASYVDKIAPIAKQLSSRIEFLRKTKGAEKFIAYFQAFTNTYAPVEKLKMTYDEAARFPEVVVISIGTRPDAIDREKTALISSYSGKRDIWIEFGLQSIHDKTLDAINRGHSFADFEKALSLAKEFGLKVSAHIILGLPKETREDMLKTAKTLSRLKVDGIKIHLLHVLKGSPMEKLYADGKIKLLSITDYADLAAEFLENLREDIVIQRLTGEGSRSDHIAPDWALNKIETINCIVGALKRRGGYQGKAVKS
jgi:hypothetical protein